MAAVVRALDVHGDMMRMAIASPGNDFRLGACEAPPAIISTFLGDDMTSYLEEFMNTGVAKEYSPKVKTMGMTLPLPPGSTCPCYPSDRANGGKG